METIQGALKNGRNVLDRINMPQGEFDTHVSNIRKAMQKEKLNLVLIYGYAFDSYADVAYVTNFITRLPRGALVALPLDGQPMLFFDGSTRGIPSFRKTVSDADVIAVSDMVKDCTRHLTERNMLKGRIGVAGLRQLMPYGQFKALETVLSDCEVVETNSIVPDCRLVKSIREQDEIRRAGRILREIFDGIKEFDFPSMDEHSIQAVLYKEARYSGAEDVRALFGRATDDHWYLGPAEKRTIKEGQTFSVYLSVEFERYWAEAARTFTIQDGLLIPADQGIEELFRRSAEVLKAGKTGSEAYSSITQILKGGAFEVLKEYGIGYGIGLSPEEQPRIAEREITPLAEGMAIALHLVAGNKDTGVLMKGDTLLVTEAIPVVLT
ncbi:MAG TPA: M24 family metallopeptidase [Syntrophorhabdaceae bacterium]|nr:M24 family metallopeptidase [Syntrophorhabdaceae bacterium]